MPAATDKLRIATWNINSIRLRLAGLRRVTKAFAPDVICLQEIKVANELFPHAAVRAMGYAHVAVHGQKSYHGVAILSRLPLTDIATRQWCGVEDCRHVQARLPHGIVVHNFYVPSGGDVPDPQHNPKFAPKLRFLSKTAAWFEAEPVGDKSILVGDLNIAPLETDVWSHKQLTGVVSHTPMEVAHLARLQSASAWIDAVRHFVPASERLYTWWSYRARDWAASDRGRRLDHVWATPTLGPALRGAQVIREARGWPKASDHVPVVVDLGV